MSKAIINFHPSVQSWFTSNFESVTPVQEGAWPSISSHQNTLLAAPTGSGKTLAAFLAEINKLVEESVKNDLPNECRVLYISPLKALSNDIERNLKHPLHGISDQLVRDGFSEVKIKAAVRTGDTSPSQRQAMIKNPPHILVTTPESLYLLLTSVSGRKMLSTVRTIILDEIHAMIGDKRGSHLALSMERLENLTEHPLLRIGVSATQKPKERVAQFLVGNRLDKEGNLPCNIINTGHKRALDIKIEIPGTDLTSVMANEVWSEIYDKIEALILQHKTTLIFVNTRRLAERLSHTLSEKLGETVITAHHGSMSKEHRFSAEQRLKDGQLRALVATASMELGIDIGAVDLVIQIGSPKSISVFLQRVGRSGHFVGGLPKGRLFPLTRDELVESAAIFDAVQRGELDQLVIPEAPIDILAQQIIAEVASQEYDEDELFNIFSKAYPFRNYKIEQYRELLKMLSEGYTLRRGRTGAYIHHDIVNKKLRPRKAARLNALISGGAIPDNFEFDMVLEPSGTFLGTLNEDFALESMPGDIIQLGNNSWRILRVEEGKVRVADANGQAPTIPFWFGEAPGRTIELSESVSRLRAIIASKIDLDLIPIDAAEPNDDWLENALLYLKEELHLSESAAYQIAYYLGTSYAALRVMPTRENIVLERFFDEAGDMHLVVHSPFGSRMNRAWGLSLRKRFCKKFNFELQAAATEDSIILSLGSTHSFPLEEVFSYLHPNTVREILIQALLDAPMFEIRWRWNASRALAILRNRNGKKVPPQIQRMQSEDLIALVFPDQLACLENITGAREVPDHPLVNQTIHDCLTEAMDIDELIQVLDKIVNKKVGLFTKDLKEPSPLSQEIINARPYAFLDDAPAEERRTNAVKNRRWLDPSEAKELGILDINAIQTVKEQAWPQASNADELHDAIVLSGFINETEGKLNDWSYLFEDLQSQNRVGSITVGNQVLWIAVERLPHWYSILPDLKFPLKLPESLTSEKPSPEESYREIIRGRMEIMGPIQESELTEVSGLDALEIHKALLALENDGFVFRGQFTPDLETEEWCERRLLARIHRYTLKKLRAEVEAVSTQDFYRYLFAWQGLSKIHQPEGAASLLFIIEQLEGFEAQSAAWESDILPSRMKDYDFQWLDQLCLSGKVCWGRFFQKEITEKKFGPIKSTPLSLILRKNRSFWSNVIPTKNNTPLSHEAEKVKNILLEQGALFFDLIKEESGLLEIQVEDAMKELVSKGMLSSDAFTGLRALLVPSKYKSGHKKAFFNMTGAGRWELTAPTDDNKTVEIDEIIRVLLKRYGILFRKISERESFSPPWRDLVRRLRVLEARGEIRGGRFVQGVYGEQFALPEALTLLRKIKKEPHNNELISISASDPLNLVGIIGPGKKVSALFGNRILFKDGELVATYEGKEVDILKRTHDSESRIWKQFLIQRNISPRLRAYLGKGIL